MAGELTPDQLRRANQLLSATTAKIVQRLSNADAKVGGEDLIALQKAEMLIAARQQLSRIRELTAAQPTPEPEAVADPKPPAKRRRTRREGTAAKAS